MKELERKSNNFRNSGAGNACNHAIKMKELIHANLRPAAGLDVKPPSQFRLA
jgi:hypothetical protein